MTAIAFCYTKSGFVVGADGRSRIYNSVKDEFSPSREDCRKIFGIVESGKVLAYAVIGDAVSSEDNSFDLMAEIECQRKRLSGQRFGSLHSYASAIGYKAERAYEKALRSGRLDFRYKAGAEDETENLLARVLFMGYLRFPGFVYIELMRIEGGAELRTTNQSAVLGVPALVAPAGILNAIDHDPRFAEYRLPYGREMSIEDARALVRRRIEACASPLAAEINSLCAGIGGHIHIAVVTPSGFSWLEAPVIDYAKGKASTLEADSMNKRGRTKMKAE
jgi:hypothetical protein